MANNPIIHNEGGVFRFQDYLSQIPDFLKSEDDVVTLLQLFSDYINNAYRNITVTTKFEFKLITTETGLISTQVKLVKLANLFKKSYERSLTVLYLSKPIPNPVNSNDYFLGSFEYGGEPDNLTPSIITFTKKDGDRAYVRFTNPDYLTSTGVYVYNSNNDTLTLDPYGTSQDPFLNTPNEPIDTVGGLAPRALEFTVSEVSDVRFRKAGTSGDVIYYEVFFSANIENITNSPSIVAVDNTTNYLVDYYDSVDVIPSVYEYKYNVKLASGCTGIDWVNDETQAKGFFYARDLTQYGKNDQLKVKAENNDNIDPTFYNNISELSIEQIVGDGATVIVKTTYPHEMDIDAYFNIQNTVNYDGTNYIVKEILSAVEFSFDSNISTTTENIGNIVINNLFYNKRVNDKNKYFLKVNYTNLEGSTEFVAGDYITRVTEEEITTSIFNADRVLPNGDIIYVNDNDALDYTKWKVEDKVTIRRKEGYGSTLTIPEGLVEGNLYEIASFPGEGAIKLVDVDITATGEGQYDIVDLSLYFDADSDTNWSENKITVHHGREDSTTDEVDPITLLEVGDPIRFSGIRAGVIELPTPLDETLTYKILEIDETNKTIKLTLDNVNEIIFTATGIGIVDIVRLEKNSLTNGIIKSVTIDTAFEEGTLVMESYIGDLITEGKIAKLTDGNIDFIAEINDVATLWSNNNIIFKKDTEVAYDGIRYRLLNTILVTPNSATPPQDNINYKKDMNDIIIYDTQVVTNPYMFGLYQVEPLDYNEVPDFGSGFGELANKLFIRKAEDLQLKYGHDQREWVFGPRFAPLYKVIRNGFLEVTKNLSNDVDILSTTTIENYTRAKTSYAMLLEELEFVLDRSLTSLTYDADENLVTGKINLTDGNHRLKTGLRVKIYGADQTAYNGAFEITVVDTETFTYTPLTVPTATPATGTLKFYFENTVIHDIDQITVIDGETIKVTTLTEHGFREGNTITLADCGSYYNGTYEDIIITGEYSFTFLIQNTSGFPTPYVPTIGYCAYQPVDGDYINILGQPFDNQNGLYIARVNKWKKYDFSEILNNTVIFTRQNLFDVTTNNPLIAKGDDIGVNSITRSSNIVTVSLKDRHDFRVGTVINIKNASQSEYNGRFEVYTVTNDYVFTYKIKTTDAPDTPAVAIQHKKLVCYSDKWYKFEISEIQWQKKSNALTYATADGNTEYTILPQTGESYVNNISVFSGEYDFIYHTDDPYEPDQTLSFKEGDIVNIGDYDTLSSDQIVASENYTKFRVKKGKWVILEQKLVSKVSNITVDSTDVSGGNTEYSDDPLKYIVFNDDEVDDYINDYFSGNLQVFKVDNLYANNFEFIYERIENVDTINSYHKIYNAKFDKNSVVLDRSDMDSSFIGVPDMKSPMVEKIERLAYLKDPNAIDFDMISYLAKYMGYDITMLLDDVFESSLYTNDKERETAIRKSIQNLPQFYTLKATKSGLEAMLLAFGIVGELVTLWTNAEKVTNNEYIPDYLVRDAQYTRMIDTGKPLDLIPTPHFKIKMDIGGNFDNEILGKEFERLNLNIMRYKPINTVFDGMILFIKTTGTDLSAYICMGETIITGRMQADIGFEALEFDYGSVLNNDCF